MSKTAAGRKTPDMVNGPLLGKILLFALPIIATGMLQLFYNAMDMIVVGRFNGETALAAVGATGALINLITNAFIGLSLGASVVVAQNMGAGRTADVSKTVHTSVMIGAIGGIFLAVVGIILARPMLALMETPPDVIDQSVLYTQIYFAGMPAMLLYNFGAAVLRAVGDSKHPLIFLTISGIVNVVLNVVFVYYFNMGVAGVATATDISQVLSAILALRCLNKADDCYKFEPRKLKISTDKLWEIIRIGLPAGIQSSLFSFSNVLIQSAINSFGAITMAGHTAAVNIEGFANVAVNGVSQSAMTFVGQNTGARKPERIKKIIWICTGLTSTVTIVICGLIRIFASPLLHLYTDQQAVVEWGTLRLDIICKTYILLALMDLYSQVQRGMGRSVVPMIVSLAGICGFRILWLYTAFIEYPTMMCLYISYPVSWGITGLVHFICLLFTFRSVKKQFAKEKEEKAIV